MGLNDLLYRQQVEMMRAAAADSESARAAHIELAGLYMAEIRRFSARPPWEAQSVRPSALFCAAVTARKAIHDQA